MVDGLKPVSVKTQYPTAASGRLVIVEEFTKGAKVGNQTADGKDMYWWNFKITVDKTLVVGNKVNVGIQFNTADDVVTPVQPDGTIQAIADTAITGTYTFYLYGPSRELTDTEIQGALTSALNKEYTIKQVSKMGVPDKAKGTVSVTWSDGTESSVKFLKDGDATEGTFRRPLPLYAVKLDGTTLGYYKIGSTGAIDAAGVKVDDYLIREGAKGVSYSSDTADAIKVATAGKITVTVAAPASGYDINYVTPVVITKVDVDTGDATKIAASVKVSADVKFPVTPTSITETVTASASGALLCEKDMYLRLSASKEGDGTKNYGLTVNGKVVESTVQKSSNSTALSFDIAVADLEADMLGRIVLGIAEVETTTNYKVRIGAIGAARETETIAITDTFGTTTHYIVAEDTELDKNTKWMVVNWTDGAPTFSRTSAPTSPATPVFQNAVKAMAFKLTTITESTDIAPDGYIWIVPVVSVTIPTDVFNASKVTHDSPAVIDITCGDYTDTTSGTGSGFASGRYLPVGATMELFGNNTNTALIATNEDGDDVRIGTGTNLAPASGTLTVKEAVTVSQKTVLKTLELRLMNGSNEINKDQTVGNVVRATPTVNGGTPGTAIEPVSFVDEEGRDITTATKLSEVGKCTIKINIAKDAISDTLVEGAVAVTVVGTSENIEFGSTENGVVVNEDGSWTISVPFDGGKF
ncbi:MAG: hypothetical protein HFF69_10295 [Oscillospiraceae bacterium]|nr:hypothetical protein [Oscillospiraceae bacterium]